MGSVGRISVSDLLQQFFSLGVRLIYQQAGIQNDYCSRLTGGATKAHQKSPLHRVFAVETC